MIVRTSLHEVARNKIEFIHFEDRASDHPFVEKVWRCRVTTWTLPSKRAMMLRKWMKRQSNGASKNGNRPGKTRNYGQINNSPSTPSKSGIASPP